MPVEMKMSETAEVRVLWFGVACEVVGLLLAIVSVVWFHRVTMLVFFAAGIPLTLVGVLAYVYVVVRRLIRVGAL